MSVPLQSACLFPVSLPLVFNSVTDVLRYVTCTHIYICFKWAQGSESFLNLWLDICLLFWEISSHSFQILLPAHSISLLSWDYNHMENLENLQCLFPSGLSIVLSLLFSEYFCLNYLLNSTEPDFMYPFIEFLISVADFFSSRVSICFFFQFSLPC